jgi:alpha-L-fucosidase
MNQRILIIFPVLIGLGLAMSNLPNIPQSDQYVFPQDPLVRKNLEVWQDLKLGFMMHWGLYSHLGIVESWALCSEDQPFQDRGGIPYTEFKKMYFGLIKKFNPHKFDPGPWAKAAREAGMKYLVFTTKHHDGFCMFDTRYTDFKITSPQSPFGNHHRANITKEIFKAFRRQGFKIGAYFSKPDWHHPDYWSPLWATPNRNNNYDTKKYPEKWQRFRDFTYNQIKELMTQYGPMDILWLDGGWVRPHHTINDEVRSWRYDISRWEQDIDMPRIVNMARKHQPGILVVDRTVHGPYENYRTPEQKVPEVILPYPWETCLTLTQSWGYNKKPVYKSTKELIHTLIDVVTKGGNLLLNVGPTPEGTIETEAYNRLKELGQWLKINGSGIYATRPYNTGKRGGHFHFSRSKDNKILYLFLLKWPGEEVRVQSVRTKRSSKIFMLGYNNPLNWTQSNHGLIINLPQYLQSPKNRPCQHAWTLHIEL